MLLDEDPATLIHHTIGNFNIAPDKIAITRINDCQSGLQQSRHLQLSTAQQSLKRLTRTLNTLQTQQSETLATYSPDRHVREVSELDSTKFRTAKQAQDLEVSNERLQAQLWELESRLQELESQGVDGGEGGGQKRLLVEDEVLLKLRVYRGLGFEREVVGAESAKNGGEEEERVVLRKGKEGVHVVNMDKKFSRYFYANYFWERV